MTKHIVSTEHAPKAIGPYSQAVQQAEMLFVSGQLPLNPATGKLADGIEAQTQQCLENIKAILTAAGSDLSKVVKTTIFLKDLDNFQVVNQIYGSYFTESYPARSTVQIARLPLEAAVEIEAIATIQ
ncbi:MAG: RidA family protein [Peptococcaceae bacterium]|nr:RidA family protein [Peptococcaceae bacterium]